MKIYRWAAVSLCLVLSAPLGHARGRQPDDNEDSYPDYNKLEMHPKPPKETPPNAVTSAQQPPAVPPARPTLNTPLNAPDMPGTEEDTPRPPPVVVPMPDNASEPRLPEDMMDTLVPSATVQMSSPTAK